MNDQSGMTQTVAILDHYRGWENHLETVIRREMIRLQRVAERECPVVQSDHALHAQLLASPAESWDEVAARANFLLERLRPGGDAVGPDLRTLLRRVLQDMLRLAHKQARAPCD